MLMMLLLTTAVDGCLSAGVGGCSRIVDKVLVNKFFYHKYADEYRCTDKTKTKTETKTGTKTK